MELQRWMECFNAEYHHLATLLFLMTYSIFPQFSYLRKEKYLIRSKYLREEDMQIWVRIVYHLFEIDKS